METETGRGCESAMSMRVDARLMSIRLRLSSLDSFRSVSATDGARSGKKSDGGVRGVSHGQSYIFDCSSSAIVRLRPTSSFQTSRKRTPRVTMRKALSSISSKTYSTSSSVGVPLAISWKFLAVLTRDDKSDSRPFRVLRSPSCCLTKLASRVRHSDFSLSKVSPNAIQKICSSLTSKNRTPAIRPRIRS